VTPNPSPPRTTMGSDRSSMRGVGHTNQRRRHAMTDNENTQNEAEVEGQVSRWGRAIEPEAEQAEVEGQLGKWGQTIEPEAEQAEVEGQCYKAGQTIEPEAEQPEVEGQSIKGGY
jgi:hypothetical protein